MVLKSYGVERATGLFDHAAKVMATDEGSFLRIFLVARRGPFVEQFSVFVHQRPKLHPGARKSILKWMLIGRTDAEHVQYTTNASPY